MILCLGTDMDTDVVMGNGKPKTVVSLEGGRNKVLVNRHSWLQR